MFLPQVRVLYDRMFASRTVDVKINCVADITAMLTFILESVRGQYGKDLSEHQKLHIPSLALYALT